jgi:hypothetical protein
MADTPISGFTGRTVLDGTEEVVCAYSGGNYKYDLGQLMLYTNAEYTAAGELVYPFFVSPQTTTYGADSRLDEVECTFNSKTWTMTMTYGTSGVTKDKVTVRSSTDGTTTWNQTMTYDGSTGELTNVGNWIAT